MNSGNNTAQNNFRRESTTAQEITFCGNQFTSLIALGLEQNNPQSLKIIIKTLDELDIAITNAKDESDLITFFRSAVPPLSQEILGSNVSSRFTDFEPSSETQTVAEIAECVEELKILRTTIFLSSDFLNQTPLLQSKLSKMLKALNAEEVFISNEPELSELMSLLTQGCCENLFYAQAKLKTIIINLPMKNKIIEIGKDQIDNLQIITISKETGRKTSCKFSNFKAIEMLELLYVDQLKQKFIDLLGPRIDLLTSIEIMNHTGTVCQNPKENLLAIMKLLGFRLASYVSETGEASIAWEQNKTEFNSNQDNLDSLAAAMKTYFNSDLIFNLEKPLNPQEIPYILKNNSYSLNNDNKSWSRQGLLANLKKLFLTS